GRVGVVAADILHDSRGGVRGTLIPLRCQSFAPYVLDTARACACELKCFACVFVPVRGGSAGFWSRPALPFVLVVFLKERDGKGREQIGLCKGDCCWRGRLCMSE
ncbi:unnamed protein product, partial [Ectocarpus sp. 6 AP-2014]